jgi:hypothetical protein
MARRPHLSVTITVWWDGSARLTAAAARSRGGSRCQSVGSWCLGATAHGRRHHAPDSFFPRFGSALHYGVDAVFAPCGPASQVAGSFFFPEQIWFVGIWKCTHHEVGWGRHKHMA